MDDLKILAASKGALKTNNHDVSWLKVSSWEWNGRKSQTPIGEHLPRYAVWWYIQVPDHTAFLNRQRKLPREWWSYPNRRKDMFVKWKDHNLEVTEEAQVWETSRDLHRTGNHHREGQGRAEWHTSYSWTTRSRVIGRTQRKISIITMKAEEVSKLTIEICIKHTFNLCHLNSQWRLQVGKQAFTTNTNSEAMTNRWEICPHGELTT